MLLGGNRNQSTLVQVYKLNWTGTRGDEFDQVTSEVVHLCLIIADHAVTRPVTMSDLLIYRTILCHYKFQNRGSFLFCIIWIFTITNNASSFTSLILRAGKEN